MNKQAMIDNVVKRHLNKSAALQKTAGEVRFVKDKGPQEWGYEQTGPSTRAIDPNYVFHEKNLKPLSKTLRASLAALGHTLSAYNSFTKIKSRNISPDGNLGGRGYIMKVVDIRRQLQNCTEALSAITDTLYDEIHADHWHPSNSTENPRERIEVKQIMRDVDEIREDPEQWAELEEDSIGEEDE
jgi:hypothetical protein